MEKLSERISFSKNKEETEIQILPDIKKGSSLLMTLWLLAWSASGIIIFFEVLKINTNDATIFLIVFTAFWIYFEYKIGYAILWRRGGKEIIRVAPDKIYLKRDMNGKGKVHAFDLENVRKIKKHEGKEWDFFKYINQSYFMVAGESISFTYYGREIKFGVQLSEEETKKLLKFFRHNTPVDVA